jgi:hypothetical protein
LARLQLSHALRRAAAAPICDELLERLEAVDEPPWPAIHLALDELWRRRSARQLGRRGTEGA